jgi:hypothetical protein
MTQPLTYIDKLENYFHPKFLAMEINQESKKYNIVSYVKMLEEMCRARGIEIKREPFPVLTLSIYIENQTGIEKCWVIEDETETIYKIYYYDMVSMVAKHKTYRDLDGKLKYNGRLYVPEDVKRSSLNFLEENFIRVLSEIKRNMRNKKNKEKENDNSDA